MRTLQIASMVPGTGGEHFGVHMKKAIRIYLSRRCWYWRGQKETGE